MKSRHALSFGLACAALGSGATLAVLPALEHAPLAAEAIAQQPEGDAFDMEAMVATMMKLAEPGPQHKALCEAAGSWEAKMEFQWDPTAQPDVTYGSMECKPILGGRYTVSTFKGEVVMPTGKVPFEGFGINGYDNMTNEYFTVWCDTMSTKVMVMRGKGDDAAKKVTLEGMNNTPMGEWPMKMVISRDGTDKMVDAFWEPNPATGEMMNTGSITYTRKK